MTKDAPQGPSTTIPTLSTIADARQGEGVGGNGETTAQEKPGKKPNWRGGAPHGNRNAAKPLSTVRRKIRDLKRRHRELRRVVEGSL